MLLPLGPSSILVIYVDDFKMAGPKENLDKGLEFLRKGLEIGRAHV